MKNWETLLPDKTWLLTKHFTKGRGGEKVDFIVVHHNAGNCTTEQLKNSVWDKREASAHFQVEKDGTIGQLVRLEDTAWHTGAKDFVYNQRSVGIEHANNNFTKWTISDKTLDNGAHLVAALCHYFHLGSPQWMSNVFPHNYFKATACPGALNGPQREAYMAKAVSYYIQMAKYKEKKSTPKSERPSPPAVIVNGKDTHLDTLAYDVIKGKYGYGEARQKALGTLYSSVQKRVNQILNAKTSAVKLKSIDEIAKEVIAGKWGNGAERASKLAAAGYSYQAVQNRVNTLLK